METWKFWELGVLFDKIFSFLTNASFLRLRFWSTTLEEVNLLAAFLLGNLSLVVVLFNKLMDYSFALEFIKVEQFLTHHLVISWLFPSYISRHALWHKVRYKEIRRIHLFILQLTSWKCGRE